MKRICRAVKTPFNGVTIVIAKRGQVEQTAPFVPNVIRDVYGLRIRGMAGGITVHDNLVTICNGLKNNVVVHFRILLSSRPALGRAFIVDTCFFKGFTINFRQLFVSKHNCDIDGRLDCNNCHELHLFSKGGSNSCIR
nr:MAG TPA: hypothetical protein [Caudoviricetes sp.]